MRNVEKAVPPLIFGSVHDLCGGAGIQRPGGGKSDQEIVILYTNDALRIMAMPVWPSTKADEGGDSCGSVDAGMPFRARPSAPFTEGGDIISIMNQV